MSALGAVEVYDLGRFVEGLNKLTVDTGWRVTHPTDFAHVALEGVTTTGSFSASIPTRAVTLLVGTRDTPTRLADPGIDIHCPHIQMDVE